MTLCLGIVLCGSSRQRAARQLHEIARKNDLTLLTALAPAKRASMIMKVESEKGLTDCDAGLVSPTAALLISM
jgi:hypothetical protein